MKAVVFIKYIFLFLKQKDMQWIFLKNDFPSTVLAGFL